MDTNLPKLETEQKQEQPAIDLHEVGDSPSTSTLSLRELGHSAVLRLLKLREGHHFSGCN